MIKVTFLTPTLEMHGGNLVMLRYANFLLKNNVSVTIITTDKNVEFEIDKRIRILKCKRVKLKYFDFFLFQLVYLWRMVRLIDECDVIIPIYTPLWIHAILMRKIKKINCKIVPIFQDSLDTLWVGPYIRFFLKNKNVIKNIDGIFYVSSFFKNVFRHYTCGKYYIPNGIDFGEFNCVGDVKKNDYILFVGRPNRPKGFDVFKKAFTFIKKKYPNISALVVSPTIEDECRDGIQYVKYRNRKQLVDIYMRASVYICASRAESFGLTSLESMACGTPIITTKNGGHVNYAKDGKNCLLVNNEDSVGICNAFDKLMSNSDLRVRLVKNGWKTVNKFGWKKSEELFLKVLLSLDNNTSN